MIYKVLKVEKTVDQDMVLKRVHQLVRKLPSKTPTVYAVGVLPLSRQGEFGYAEITLSDCLHNQQLWKVILNLNNNYAKIKKGT